MQMPVKFKSEAEIKAVALEIKKRRLKLGITLEQLGKQGGVNVGQLSRMEAGGFKTYAPNLQKICEILQISKGLPTTDTSPNLGPRLERFATISPKHRAAAEELVSALELLG